MKTYEIEESETRKGNPIAQNRYRYQTYTKDTDEPLQSEWAQFKNDAIKWGALELIRDFEKTGTDNIIVKVFNDMNRKAKPVVITLEEALKIRNQ